MEQGISTVTSAMTVAWILVAVGFLAVAVLVYIAIRSRARRIDQEKSVETFRSLDIEAFRNLVDAGEEAFLREHLSPRKFREIKRQRAWAALMYTREVGKAATALARIGQAAQRSSDAKIAASGVQLAENAFRLRLQTAGAGLHLMTEMLLPGVPSRSVPSLVDQYERAAIALEYCSPAPGRGA